MFMDNSLYLLIKSNKTYLHTQYRKIMFLSISNAQLVEIMDEELEDVES